MLRLLLLLLLLPLLLLLLLFALGSVGCDPLTGLCVAVDVPHPTPLA